MKIIWLASYPRPGNTFLRFLLYHYFFGKLESSTELESKIPDLHKGFDIKETDQTVLSRRT